MELILIYFFQKVKAKTAELDYDAVRYVWELVLLWATGEVVGFFLAFKFTGSWWLRYLIGVGCGFIPGWLVYLRVLGLESQSPDYFDLGSSASFPYVDERPEPVAKKSEQLEVSQGKNDLRSEPVGAEPALSSTGIGLYQPKYKPSESRAEFRPENSAEFRPESRAEFRPESRAEFRPESRAEFRPENSAEFRPENRAEFRPENRAEFRPESRAEFRPENRAEFRPENRAEFRPENSAEFRPEFITQNNMETSQPRTSVSFKTPVETGNEPNDSANRNFFQFPYGELLSLNELMIGEYGRQTVKDLSIGAYPWFVQFKTKYDNREVKAALMILENVLCEEANNGLIWLLFGVLYKEVLQDYDKALQFCLTGAKRCNLYKISLLTEAAELLLLGKKDLMNAFKFFCMAVIAITEDSKAWGDSNVEGCIAQERAFHFIRVLLTAFNFTDYRLYLERNISFCTGLDQKLIENVLSLCAESPFRTEIEQLISQRFPLIIEKLQALA
jgi:hypothetical protein